MKSISIIFQEHTLEETDSILEQLEISRDQYINEAINFYNKYQKRRLLEEQLAKESVIVSKDSLEVLGKFESLNLEK